MSRRVKITAFVIVYFVASTVVSIGIGKVLKWAPPTE